MFIHVYPSFRFCARLPLWCHRGQWKHTAQCQARGPPAGGLSWPTALSQEHRQKAESWHDVWWHPLISCIHYIRVWYVDRTMILLLHTVAIGFHMLSPQHQKSSNGQLRKGVLDFLTFLRSSLRRETQALQPGFADRICEMKFFKHWRPCK